MSNENDPFLELQQSAIDQRIKQSEIYERKQVIEDKKTSIEFDRLKKLEEEAIALTNASFGSYTEAYVDRLQRDSDDYIEASKTPIPFINACFDKKVPFFRKNLILIGAESGHGKSTAVANIINGLLPYHDPNTGKPGRVLVITNEEKPEDVFHRVTCLNHGWSYSNHSDMSDEQRAVLSKTLGPMIRSGKILAVDSGFLPGVDRLTTSVEGIETIFDKLIENKDFYSAVIIDYYQNITSSKKNPNMSSILVQELICSMLDHYKNEYPAPIVVMTQLHNNKDDESVAFAERIKGRRIIYDKCTFAMEIIPKHKSSKTEWVIHKARFGAEFIGKKLTTGYEKGKFVEYTEEFKHQADIKEERENKAEEFGNVFDKKDHPAPGEPLK